MVDFLDFGKTPAGDYVPLVPDTDPRGKSSDGFYQLILEERERKEAEEAYWEQLAQDKNFGPMHYLGESIKNESITANLAGMLEDYSQEFDINFDPEPFVKEEWPDWRKEAVREAKNPHHAQMLIDKTEEQQAYAQEGAHLGGVGTALNLAGAIINPENFILGAGEVAALTKLGLSGAARITAGASIGALSNTAQEAVIIANDKSRDRLGLLTAAGFGAAFGAVGSMFSPKALSDMNKIDQKLGKGLSDQWKRDFDFTTGDIQPNRELFRSPDAQAWDDAVEEGLAGYDVTNHRYVVSQGEQAFEYDTKAQATAALRLRKRNIEVTPETIKEQIDLDYEALTKQYDKDVKKRHGGFWSSIGLEGLSSKNPHMRKLFSVAVEDASGTGGRQVANHSAALRSDMHAMKMRSLWHPERQRLSRAWIKEQGIGTIKPWDRTPMQKFDKAVLEEIGFRRQPETRPRGQQASPHIKEAADTFEKFNEMRYEMLSNAGAKGYDQIQLDNLYHQHKWDGIAMTKIMKKYNKDFVIDLLAKGIMRGKEFKRADKYGHLGEKLTEDYKMRTSRNMAKAIYNRFTRRPDTADMARAGWMTKTDMRDLERAVRDVVDNAADMKHILAAAEGKDSRVVHELLTQIDLDINTRIDDVSVKDLMDTNLGASMDTDIRRAAGRAAMGEIGFGDESDFLEFVENIGRWNRENTDMTEKQLKRETRKAQGVWRIVMGENLEREADSTLANMARGFRKVATLASLNQVGFAQMAETGRLVGSVGVKEMIRQIPEWRNMLRRMKNGQFKDAVLNDIEAAFGIRLGDMEMLNHPMYLAESGGADIAAADAKGFMQGVQTCINKGLHVQGWLNGMNVIMKAQHRMHARGFFNRMYQDLQKAELNPRRARRYADIGLSMDDLQAIKKEFQKNAEMGEGWFGQQRPVNFHLAQFEAGLRDKLGTAYWKSQNQAIQRNLGGETGWWMENTLGKIFTQFRTFPLVAIEKQTLHDLKHFDIEAFTTAAFGLGVAGLAYSAKTYANSFGLPAKKRKQYLKNRLTPEKLFAGASGWTGQAAIFPDVMRSAGDFGFSNPWSWTEQKGQSYRSYYRERGLDLGAAGPVGAMADNAYRFASGVGQAALTPAEFQMSTFKYGVRTLPFSNNLVVKALQNYTLE